jgi:hypothetical protein
MRRVGRLRQGRLRPRECGEGGNFRGRSAAVSEVATVEVSEECREAIFAAECREVESMFAAEYGRRRRFLRQSAVGGGYFRGVLDEGGTIKPPYTHYMQYRIRSVVLLFS